MTRAAKPSTTVTIRKENVRKKVAHALRNIQGVKKEIVFFSIHYLPPPPFKIHDQVQDQKKTESEMFTIVGKIL